jgi:DNA-binding MarR family transcriptional regulator
VNAQTDNDNQALPGPVRQLSTTLGRVLREISRDYERRVLDRLHRRGHPQLSLAHQVVFSNLGLGRPRVTELASRARITQQAMGKTLRELEQLGYLQCAVDETDRRARVVQLTALGARAVRDALACCEETRAEYADMIGAEEIAELDVRLRAAASRLNLDYLPPTWAEDT